MASTSSTNVNEILPGLEDFLRSMLSSTHLENDHRQIAAMYLDKLDQYGQSTNQQSSLIDDQSLMNTDIISDAESDDFTDEEEEQQTPTITRHSSVCDTVLYDSTKQESNTSSSSQWYADIPKNDSPEAQISNGKHSEKSSSIMQSRLSIPSSTSSSIIADGLLLTYDKNHNWIWRYYVLDDYDLICFPADKKSRLTTEGESDKNCSPLWVSDITNAKVHTTVIDKIECLCLYIGLAEAIYVRPSDPNQINMWLKAFRDAASSQKSRDTSKNQSNVKILSRNARRMFAQFNRKKGQIVSHLLDQMANVTGVDDKTRKHCELRGFLVISLDNSTFLTKYCTIVDGIFRIHKSRLSEQTDHEFILNRCKLSFPEERTRDIQFALTDEQIRKIFIRGNNIYSMGRLLNTLAKYVEIIGSSEKVFKSDETTSLTLPNKSQTSSRIRSLSQVNEGYSSSSSTVKSLPLNITKNIYRSASKLHDGRTNVLPNRTNKSQISIQQDNIISNETYDQPKSYNKTESIDRNNNHILITTDKRKNEKTRSESPSPINIIQSHRSSSPDTLSLTSSHADPVFCIRSIHSSSSQHRNSHRHRRPYPLPRRTSADYVNKFTNLFTRHTIERQINTKSRSTSIPSSQSSSSSCYNSNRIQPSILNDKSTYKHVYDIPITIERSTKSLNSTAEQNQKLTCAIDDDLTYDNVSKTDGIGKFRFVIPFNHSSSSAFTTIKSINSPSSSSSSTLSSNSILPQTSSSSSSNNSNTNTNNNNNNRPRLMTAV
ncbi:unnamed protein product [Adineta steineri]|uniref:PH domain-containing protein n=1 Tax=Adineta steineri TaxID=433720 RepID=A0A814VLL6_9BILA|nr:unnamed protein product [Adineta steineri]CAF1190549.1 unnamed protein product [Adineta steineri]